MIASRQTTHRWRAFAAVGAIVSGCVFPAAAGATTRVSYSAGSGLQITSLDAVKDSDIGLEGISNNSRIRVASARRNGIVDPLEAGSGCSPLSGAPETHVECAITGAVIVSADLRGGVDRFFATFADSFVAGGPGNDTLQGGAGFDLLDGGDGNDTLGGKGGNDVLEGRAGNDVFEAGSPGGTDTMRGSTGDDTFKQASGGGGGADRFDGGKGINRADYSARSTPVNLSTATTSPPNDGAAGEGDDMDGVTQLVGGSAGDTISATNLGSSTPTMRVTGGAGDDTLTVSDTPGVLDGGTGADTIRGGSFADEVFARDGVADDIKCVGAIDFLRADLRDEPISNTCENLDGSDRREGPNVVFRSRSVFVNPDGSLSVRLACPRKLRRRCAGALSVRIDKPRSRFGRRTRYSIRPGRRATVKVKLRASQRRAARRRRARVRVRSVERGRHGRKTTQRSLRVRR